MDSDDDAGELREYLEEARLQNQHAEKKDVADLGVEAQIILFPVFVIGVGIGSLFVFPLFSLLWFLVWAAVWQQSGKNKD